MQLIFCNDLFLKYLEMCGTAPQTSLQWAAAAGAAASRTHPPVPQPGPSSNNVHMHPEGIKHPAVDDHHSTYPIAFATLKPDLNAKFNAFLD